MSSGLPFTPDFDVAPDGRFLMIRDVAPPGEEAPTRIVVVLNWFEELKQLVPTGGR